MGGELVYEKYYQLGKKYDMTKFNADGSTEFDIDRVDMIKAKASAIAQGGDRWAIYDGYENGWSSYVASSTNFDETNFRNIIANKYHGTYNNALRFYFMVGTA